MLTTTSDERPIVEFIKSAPWIPYWTFCTLGGHDRYAIFEFPLGNELKCDLLLLNSYSGSWEALFVEFESAADKIFTKNGTPTKRLAIAQRQIDDWSTFINENRDTVRRDMVRYAKTRDRLGYSRGTGEPSNFSGDRLSDPNTYIAFRYKIVIGRRTQLAAEQRRLVGRYRDNRDAELVTYDRLLALAERRYEETHMSDPAFIVTNVT